jgi:hypothetical protein
MKEELQPDNNFKYYSYILIYVDDILVIHHNATSVLAWLNKYLPLKPSSVGDPDIYILGTNQPKQNLQMMCGNGDLAPPGTYTKQ